MKNHNPELGRAMDEAQALLEQALLSKEELQLPAEERRALAGRKQAGLQADAITEFEKGLEENITPEQYEGHMEAVRLQRDVGKVQKPSAENLQ